MGKRKVNNISQTSKRGKKLKVDNNEVVDPNKKPINDIQVKKNTDGQTSVKDEIENKKNNGKMGRIILLTNLLL